MIIESITKENDDKTTFHHFQMTSKGTGNGLIDLYKDLESLGFKIKSKNYLDQVYVLLSIDKSSLEKYAK